MYDKEAINFFTDGGGNGEKDERLPYHGKAEKRLV